MFYAYERYHTNGRSIFFPPFLARASSLLGEFTSGFVRIGSVLRMEVLLSGCWSHWSSQTWHRVTASRSSPSFTCVSEIYNNRAPLPRPVRVVLSWLRGIGRTHLGEQCTSPINSLICFEIIAARPGETDRRSRSSNGFVISAMLSTLNCHTTPACIHTFIPSFYGHMHITY